MGLMDFSIQIKWMFLLEMARKTIVIRIYWKSIIESRAGGPDCVRKLNFVLEI